MECPERSTWRLSALAGFPRCSPAGSTGRSDHDADLSLTTRPVNVAAPASFIEPPGFLLHHWKAGSGLLTHSIPVGSFPGPFPFA